MSPRAYVAIHVDVHVGVHVGMHSLRPRPRPRARPRPRISRRAAGSARLVIVGSSRLDRVSMTCQHVAAVEHALAVDDDRQPDTVEQALACSARARVVVGPRVRCVGRPAVGRGVPSC